MRCVSKSHVEHERGHLLRLDLFVTSLLGGVVINEVSQLILELVVLLAELVEISHVIHYMNCLHLSSKELIILQLHNLQRGNIDMQHAHQKQPFSLV